MPSATRPTGGLFLVRDTAGDGIFTREDITHEQRMFADTAAQFMRQEVLPVEARLFDHDWPLTRALLKKAASLDLLGIEVPEEYGGLALSKVSGALVSEQIAVHPSFGASIGVHTSIGMLPLVYFGTPAQKAQYLPRLVAGDLVGAYALTEPGSGSDARAAKTTAVLSPDRRHYRLNGQKMWITNGGFADLFTIFAKVDGEHFTAFLVERGMGVVSGAEEKKLGLDGSSTTALMLDDVHVPVENVLGAVGEGHKVAFNILNLGRVKLGARNMASARLALAHAVRYARERRQFGRAIAEFGMIQEKLADMAVRCFVGDAMVYRTLGDVDGALNGVDPADTAAVLKTIESFAAECSVNKVFTSEALAFAADEAIQVFGGNGYSREFPVERLYRDARITRIYEGTNEINRLLIATRLLKSGLAMPDDDTRPPMRGGALAAERQALAAAKALARGLFAAAGRRFGDAIKEQQAVLARLANVAIEIFAVESALGRADRKPAAADLVRVYLADAIGRMVASASGVLGVLTPEQQTEARDGLASLRGFEPGDVVAARARIAHAVIAAGGDLG